MPRKTASKLENTELNEIEKPVVEKKTTTRKSSTTKATKKTSKTSTTKGKSTKATAKTTTSKKVETKKASSSKRTTKTSSTKTTRKTTTSRSSTRKKKISADEITSTTNLTQKIEIIEYYDLPYRYNQTIVKILAQTPNTLFVYWDISDEDRKKYEEEYGKNFFEETVPVLIVHNKTMNYYFEIEVNDFANSWYFKVNDAKCDYEIELGRRAKQKNNIIPNDYLYVASSNTIEAPNNHILFEKNQKVLFFRNVKTNEKHSKEVSQFQFMKYIGRIYNIYDIYKKIYKNDELQDLEKKNPSSKM